ncbi:aminopeptidase P family N-terminal domain-containing protein [Anaeromassilibacillus senegalensis]|uniref:aminopeptidase P family N-terminal domain-containing protein n=1 Tax=Anaeromassilibacillus senegalensis TaxID=1673717 RepID=UPI000939F5FF|nr:aminopeptidase P family N-terminal domain-containing protein [Anaeromassilibacillus senegalensis]
MKTVPERIAALRAAMKSAGVDGYLIPSSDPHMSEYLPDCYGARSWFSGFTGSVGTLAVTAEKAALWVDGRYFIQAEHQLAGSGIELMRVAVKGTPEIPDWLAENLPQGGVMGLDGMITAISTVEKLEKEFAEKKITIKDIDFVSPLWEGRPPVPATTAWLLGTEYAGKTAHEKLEQLRDALAEQGADATLLSRLESVAWTLNLRADDIAYNPFPLSYCLVLPESATLFINKKRVPAEVEATLNAEGVQVAPYEDAASAIASVRTPVTALYEPEGTSYTLYHAMKANASIKLQAGEEPVQPLKGVKNEVEIQNIKNAHVKDGVAMVRFQMALEAKMASGETVTECDVADMLTGLRKAQPLNLGDSFDTIAAYGANAAMMHYHALPETCAKLEPHGFLLVDSGAQFRDGTTDITRTYTMGELTDEEKTFYTLVLKSHIDLARVVFLEGCTGGNLDIMARSAVWRHGIDYRCGTGHGVGFVGGVHEGPQNLRITNNVAFMPGMTVTDEPGIYEEGKVGIRIENELLCKEWGVTEYGRFLCFEPITYCPIDVKPVKVDLLDNDELDWLNEYHALVYKTLESSLTPEEQDWLKTACAPLSR